MAVLSYSNAQFRSILNGLGLRNQGSNEPNFPVSNDEGNLDTDRPAAILHENKISVNNSSINSSDFKAHSFGFEIVNLKGEEIIS